MLGVNGCSMLLIGNLMAHDAPNANGQGHLVKVEKNLETSGNFVGMVRLCSTQEHDLGLCCQHVTSRFFPQDQTDRVICWAFHFLLSAWHLLRPHARAKERESTQQHTHTHTTDMIDLAHFIPLDFLFVHVSWDSGKLCPITAHDMGLTQWPATTLSEMAAVCAA